MEKSGKGIDTLGVSRNSWCISVWILFAFSKIYK